MKDDFDANKKRAEVKELLIKNNVSEFAKRIFLSGRQKFNKAKNISFSGEIETMKSADGIYRAKKISDEFCNCTFAGEYGIIVDTYQARSTKIPILKIGNILMTVKSIKNVDDIVKNPSSYMKELVRHNIKLENQINMFDKIDGNIESNSMYNSEKYYGILAYHFDIAEELEHITMVFYDTKLENELLRIQAPQDMLITREPVAYEDKPIVSKENINKDNSLKKILTLKTI